ncbi:hypothetical protein, partial [Aneurinibacillus danicus]|uniref:hypothetical protein n=1 Tax=Aneurinibacillus danicus TaxID=267746 RepID=UPI001C3FCC09
VGVAAEMPWWFSANTSRTGRKQINTADADKLDFLFQRLLLEKSIFPALRKIDFSLAYKLRMLR